MMLLFVIVDYLNHFDDDVYFYSIKNSYIKKPSVIKILKNDKIYENNRKMNDESVCV